MDSSVDSSVSSNLDMSISDPDASDTFSDGQDGYSTDSQRLGGPSVGIDAILELDTAVNAPPFLFAESSHRFGWKQALAVADDIEARLDGCIVDVAPELSFLLHAVTPPPSPDASLALGPSVSVGSVTPLPTTPIQASLFRFNFTRSPGSARVPDPLGIVDEADTGPPALADQSDDSEDESDVPPQKPRAPRPAVPRPVDPPADGFQPFRSLPCIVSLLTQVCQQDHISVKSLKALACKALQDPDHVADPSFYKPHAEDPVAMAASQNLQSGANPLPPGSSSLNVDAITAMHKEHCSKCKCVEATDPTCYIDSLIRTVTHGYNPGLLPHIPVTPLTPYRGNGTSTLVYQEATHKALHKMIHKKYVRNATPLEIATYHPVAVHSVIKNSDRHRVRALFDLEITDAASLEHANTLLVNRNLKPISVRAVFDYKANGVNASLPSFPFSQPGILEASAVISPDSYGIIMDMASYFFQFPIAEEFQPYALFQLEGIWYIALRLLFGVRTAPHLGFMWAAELHAYFVHHNVPHTVMQDDHLVSAPASQDVYACRDFMLSVFRRMGFETSPDKEQLGQYFTYIGFEIDTREMTMIISSDSARSFLGRLDALDRFLNSTGRIPLFDEIRSMTGCMVHFSQLLQAAMTYIHWMFEALKVYPNIGPQFGIATYLREASAYFRSALTPWAEGHTSGMEFPILNTSVFADNSHIIGCVQTDASGLYTHGYGGFWGYLDTIDPQAFARVWSNRQTDMSHGQELEALLAFLRLAVLACKLLFWITDCKSAAYSINKGSCSHENVASLGVLRDILHLADDQRISIVAFWMPRLSTNARWADRLTHLSHLLGRDFDGPFSELAAIPYFTDSQPWQDLASPSSPDDRDQANACTPSVREVHPVLLREQAPLSPAVGNGDRTVSVQFCGIAPWVRQKPSAHTRAAPEGLLVTDTHLVKTDQDQSPPSVDPRASIPRCRTITSEGADPLQPDPPYSSQLISIPRGPDVRVSSSDGIRGTSPPRRATSPSYDTRCGMDIEVILQAPSLSHEDTSQGCSNLGNIPEAQRAMRRSCSPSPLRSAPAMVGSPVSTVPLVAPAVLIHHLGGVVPPADQEGRSAAGSGSY